MTLTLPLTLTLTLSLLLTLPLTPTPTLTIRQNRSENAAEQQLGNTALHWAAAHGQAAAMEC